MIAWVNFAVLLFASLLFLYFNIRSVSPATMEKVFGPDAYTDCGRDRIIAMVFEMIAVMNYIVYFFFPLNTPFPVAFPWSWWISIGIAVVIGIPSLILMLIGMKDAGEETLIPKKDHTMYGGIYKIIRHPQATGEVALWWAIAFSLSSPFLALISFIYISIFIIFCFAEEQDLLWRTAIHMRNITDKRERSGPRENEYTSPKRYPSNHKAIYTTCPLNIS
jgi:protein-S-isoprenylcysteine O-methyltransferase Ste14